MKKRKCVDAAVGLTGLAKRRNSALSPGVAILALLLTSFAMIVPSAAVNSRYAAVRVVDQSTGLGVPLVRLCSTSSVCYWTDSNGVVAIDEPDFLGKRVFFSIESEGYGYERNVLEMAGSIINVFSRLALLAWRSGTGLPAR